MSYPTQDPPGEGAPQQSYGVPAQQPYADPNQPYGAQGQQPYGAQGQQPYGAGQQPYGTPSQPPPYGMPGQPPYPTAPVQGSNGMATAGLIFGILPTPLLGLIFSILGLVRAPKVGGTGRTRSWVGLVLSVLWTLLAVLLIALGAFATNTSTGKKIVQRTNPACIAAESQFEALQTKITADSSDPNAIKADLQGAITNLNSDAKKSDNSTATAAIKTLAGDIQTLLDDVNSGTVPPQTLITQMTTDGAAVDTACGR